MKSRFVDRSDFKSRFALDCLFSSAGLAGVVAVALALARHSRQATRQAQIRRQVTAWLFF